MTRAFEDFKSELDSKKDRDFSFTMKNFELMDYDERGTALELLSTYGFKENWALHALEHIRDERVPMLLQKLAFQVHRIEWNLHLGKALIHQNVRDLGDTLLLSLVQESQTALSVRRQAIDALYEKHPMQAQTMRKLLELTGIHEDLRNDIGIAYLFYRGILKSLDDLKPAHFEVLQDIKSGHLEKFLKTVDNWKI